MAISPASGLERAGEPSPNISGMPPTAVAIIGLLQMARVGDMHEVLARYYSAVQVRDSLELRRATSTLGVWQAEFTRVSSPLLPYTAALWEAAGNASAPW